MNDSDEKPKLLKSYLLDELLTDHRQLSDEEQKLLRSYLLGELNQQQREEVEERLMTDEDFFTESLLVENDLIDDYLQGELSADERKKFEATILLTLRGRQQVELTRDLRGYADEVAEKKLSPTDNVVQFSRWPKPLLNPYFRVAASILIVLGLTFVVWRVFIYQSPADNGLALLKEVYKEKRTLEARISDFDYAPLITTRGGKAEPIDTLKRRRAEYLLQTEVDEHPDRAKAHHGLGRYYLATQDFDKAIAELGAALSIEPQCAQIHSDLGAAYLEKAVSNYDKLNISDLARSLESLNKALEIDSSLLPAYFNKALCLQRMNTPTSAKEAWKTYLEKDAHSEWSKEAERNLQLLYNQGFNLKTPEEVFQDFLAAYRQKDEAQAWRIQRQTKEMITGAMIPFQLARRLTTATLSGQTEAAKEFLQAFGFAGELETKQTGDPFFAELARFYLLAESADAAALGQAHQALQQGYLLCLKGLYKDALPHFEIARKRFLQVGNIWESKVVDYWRAYCFYYGEDWKASSALLKDLAVDCQRRHYYWLESQSYFWLANISALLGKYSQGLEEDKKALQIAVATSDLYSVQKNSSQVAGDYKFLGRLQEALEFHQRSLPSADDYFVSYRQFWRSLSSVTDTLFALRLYSAAEAYEQEALQLALHYFNDSALTSSTYRRLGQIYAGQENYSAATQALELSLKALQAIDNDPISKRLFGLSMLQTGNVKRQMRDYASALEYYQRAAERLDSTRFGLYNYTTHKAILLCHLLNKDDRAIEQELPKVLELFEQNRRAIKEELNRNHFFDTEQGVYELAIDYEYRRNHKEQSYHYVELSKARSLQDAIIGGATASKDLATPDVVISSVSQPLTIGLVQENLPPNLRLIEYVVLQDRLLIWVLTKTHFEVVEQPVALATLEVIANEYLRVLIRDDADSVAAERQLAAKLHDQLLAPVEDYLAGADEVVLVPDKFLFKIPFAALLSRRSGQRVVEQYTLLYAPSATVMALCTKRAQTKAPDKEAERLLIVGNPLIDRQRYPELLTLPSAAIEAETIKAFYRTKAVFIGSEASKHRIEPELGRSDVLHFATHYLADEGSPSRSKLLLTAARQTPTSRDNDLSLQEIQTKRLSNAKLAILSACQSGIEQYYASEGLIGLARAFLAAGIPLVVASQWAVESDSTAELMIEFHRQRKAQGLPTTRALREAQRRMLQHEDERYRRPYYWAAFFAIGGHASY